MTVKIVKNEPGVFWDAKYNETRLLFLESGILQNVYKFCKMTTLVNKLLKQDIWGSGATVHLPFQGIVAIWSKDKQNKNSNDR